MSTQPGFHHLTLALLASAPATFAPLPTPLTTLWALLLTFPLPPLTIELRGPAIVTYALPEIAGIDLSNPK